MGPTTRTVHVAVALKLRNTLQLEQTIARVNTPGDAWFGQFLSPDQFTSTYGPLPSQARAVAGYLKTAGFTNVQVTPNRLYVTGTAPASVAARAFNTTLADYTLNGKTIYNYTAAPMVPASLGGTVLAVLGLSNADQLRYGPPQKNTVDPTTLDPSTIGTDLTPQDLQLVYNAGTVPAALNTTVAIITTGNSMDPVVKDIARFKKKFHLPDFPVTVVNVGDGPSTVTDGETEWSMDTQTSVGLAGGVKELVIYAGGSASTDQIAIGINQFAVDNKAKAASLSAGTCDYFATISGFMASADQSLMQAAAQGQTLFSSSGDSGTACPPPQGGGATNGVPLVGVPNAQMYPSSSTYAVSVGGTTILRNDDGTRNDEIVWSAGGGGISEFEAAPSWQLPFLATAPLNSASGIGRGLPDVSMDADFLLSPAAFYDAGALTSNGGTSLASPLALGAWARIVDAHGGALGFAAPALYALGTPGTPSSVTALMDITEGSNGAPATPGWDYATGLGSFDISAVNAAIHDVLANISFTPHASVDAGNACALPGLLVNDDPAGDNLDAGVPGHDLRQVHIAEPEDAPPLVTAGQSKLVITMDIDDASSLPPQSIYFVFFSLGDGVEHYVSYWTTPAPSGTPAVPSNPVSGGGAIDLPFAYGHKYNDPAGAELWFDNEGATDPESFVDTANNRIVWVLSKDKIPALANNALMKATVGEIWVEDSVFGLGDTETLDSGVAKDYQQVGNANCAGKGGKVGVVLGAGAMPLSMLLPLLLAGLRRRRIR